MVIWDFWANLLDAVMFLSSSTLGALALWITSEAIERSFPRGQ